MQTRIRLLRDTFRKCLLDDVLPFWLRHAPDRECGGYFTCLDRDGSVYDPDKLCMWSQGRIAWTFAYLHNELEARTEWLDMARLGVKFLLRHGFAPDGTMYYSVARDGQPLKPSQDVYAELSSVCGFTEFARATDDERLYGRALELFLKVWNRLDRPGMAAQPYLAEARPVRVHGHSMITMNVLQELRRFRADPEYDRMIDTCIGTIVRFHLRRDRRCILELVGWNQGEDLPGSLGRRINPGHMIECGIFMIHEGRHRASRELRALGLDLIEWGFEWGWDREFGGVYNDVDEKGLPIPGGDGLLAPAKLWWQHAEALYGLTLAFGETGRADLLEKAEQVAAYCQTHFADPVHGEWFAVLDRRGHVLCPAKGTDRKNTYHLVRNLFHACRELERLLT